MNKRFLLVALLSLFTCTSFAQSKPLPPFWDEVQAIKAYDRVYQQQPNPILFVGSSSIRKWNHLQVAFGKYNVMNRGIGGAVTNNITFYLDDIVFPYKPRQIVIYVGENDVVADDATADSILNRTVRLYQAIRLKMPEVPIVYISMKPSPSRDKYVQKTIAANDLIRKFLATQKNTAFVDIFPLMLKDGKSMPELFVADMLHMNAKGYAIWEKVLKPYLLKK
jgi:lysophospholipase L1-like esterase